MVEEVLLDGDGGDASSFLPVVVAGVVWKRGVAKLQIWLWSTKASCVPQHSKRLLLLQGVEGGLLLACDVHTACEVRLEREGVGVHHCRVWVDIAWWSASSWWWWWWWVDTWIHLA